MTRRLLASYMLLAAFILMVVALPLGITYSKRAEDRLLSDIERDGRVLAGLVEERVEAADHTGVERITDRYAEQTGGRVVVTDAQGISLADSDVQNDTPRDFSTRPEFTTALDGKKSSGIRESSTLHDEIAYVAVPIVSGTRVKGAVRVTFSTHELREEVRWYWARLGLLIAMVLALAAGLGWLMSRWALAPVEALEAGARQLAAGDLEGRISIDRGPPELRDLGTTFNTMATQLQGLVDSQRAFVADASHQLRTPLTALRLRLESLEEEVETGDTDGAQSDLDALTAEVDRMGRLVEGLLALARSEGGRVRTVRVDAGEIADQTIDRWEALAAERDITLVRNGARAAHAAAIDGALDQVLDNLIDNALDAVPGGTSVDVTVNAATARTPAQVVVRDHGPGMSAAERARATDRFWRGPASSPTGTGLGLAIVQHLVEAGGGSVELRDPAEGPGLEICVRLAADNTAGTAASSPDARVDTV